MAVVRLNTEKQNLNLFNNWFRNIKVSYSKFRHSKQTHVCSPNFYMCYRISISLYIFPGSKRPLKWVAPQNGLSLNKSDEANFIWRVKIIYCFTLDTITTEISTFSFQLPIKINDFTQSAVFDFLCWYTITHIFKLKWLALYFST